MYPTTSEDAERFDAELRFKTRLIDDKNYQVVLKSGDRIIATFHFRFIHPITKNSFSNVFVRNESGNLTDHYSLNEIESCNFLG
nr:MAG TPA: hypothetical protein [Caudoviricetes sp.]